MHKTQNAFWKYLLKSIKRMKISIVICWQITLHNKPHFLGWFTDLVGIFNNRGFSCDVISSQFCKSSYLRPPCWFPVAWPGIGKNNKISHYFLISSYHNTKLRPSDKIIKIHTRLKFQILLQSKSKVPVFFVVFSPYCTKQKETKERGKIVRV